MHERRRYHHNDNQQWHAGWHIYRDGHRRFRQHECERGERRIAYSHPVDAEAPTPNPRKGIMILCGRRRRDVFGRWLSAAAVAGLVLFGAYGVLASAPPPAQEPDPVFVGAGDIAGCPTLINAEATAKLLDATPGTVFTLGDNAYEDGSVLQFRNCYEPTWGREKSRTRPAPGNHEYHSRGAKPYFDYFGASAGEPGKGYYSYDLGAWHIIVLNSECVYVGGCQEGSAQEVWLRSDLQAHPAKCTLAYWHRPLFSSVLPNKGDRSYLPFWKDLYAAGAEIVLNGHDHHYERFVPQDPDGRPDPAHGIREFVVGTGGRSHDPFGPSLLNSEVREAATFGVLKLVLHANSYDWTFIPVAGRTFHDQGSGTCH
jgi:acid phosphatase type 7